ncbi:transporter substrate-binding domain-containing protein [Mesorhizobium sp. M0088]|uniref:transporter substrate-binding domain-containing protein n=1 Tax=Mesorhizobium sp. M0088 TaxID=2956873 RepID=UPI0033363E31
MSIFNRLKTCIVVLPLLFAGHVDMTFAGGQLELVKPGELSVATEGTYPPYSMQNDKGELDGIDVRLMREVAHRLGLEYKPVLLKFDSLLIGLEADQFDVIGSPLDMTDQRREKVTFSDAWIESGSSLVVQQDSPVKSSAEIAGKTIGVLAASTWADQGAQLKGEVKTYKSVTDALQDLVNGNIDAVVNDRISTGYSIKKSGLPLRIIEPPLTQAQKAWSIKKGKPELVKAINKAIAEIITDGTYEKLTSDYINFNAAPKDPIRSNL